MINIIPIITATTIATNAATSAAATATRNLQTTTRNLEQDARRRRRADQEIVDEDRGDDDAVKTEHV